MKRRDFLSGTAGAAMLAGATRSLAAESPSPPASIVDGLAQTAQQGYMPWVEVSRSILRDNMRQISRKAGGAKIMMVAKANAYGTGEQTTPLLVDDMDEVWGYMVARPREAAALLDSGVQKPILLMAAASPEETVFLARRGVQFALTAKDTPESVEAIANTLGQPLKVHFEIDTGINRQGIPWNLAVDWAKAIHATGAIEVTGSASYFIVPPDAEPQDQPWAPELQQIERFESVLNGLAANNVPTGLRHMCSSRSYFQYPQAHFDAVRIGVLAYGMCPTPAARANGRVDIEQVFEMKTRVAQVSMIPAGEYFGYGHKIKMERDTWIATTLHGVPGGTRGDRTLRINGQDCPVILSGGRLYTVAVLGNHPIAAAGDIALICGREPGYTAEDLENPWIGYGQMDPMPSLAIT